MQSENIKVLLIEDDPNSVTIIKENLAQANSIKFEVVCEERLSNGLEYLNNGSADVVILDISLPDSQGIDTIIKANPFTVKVPFVVLSNHDDETLAVKAVKEGAQDYLVKGDINHNLLVRSIRYAIERHQMLKKLEQVQLQMQHMAQHDGLTELPNRQLFYDYLNKSLERAHRYGQITAVMFLDLDNFKNINDTLGHFIGDKLLQSVAKRLQGCVRKSDVVARLGGDEFVAVLDDVNSLQNAARVAQKMIKAISEVFIVGEHELFVTTSIGISIYPSDGVDTNTLVKKADLAMYRAKEQDKNNYKFSQSDLDEAILKGKF